MKSMYILLAMIITCFVLIGTTSVIMNINWFFSPYPQPTPAAELAQDVKNKIFTQVSNDNNPSGEMNNLITSEYADKEQRTYNWPNIETLLHKNPNDVGIEEYVILLQLIKGMSEVNTNGRLSVDYDSVILFVQSGYTVTITERNTLTSILLGMKSEYQITPVLSTALSLYLEFMEKIYIPDNSWLFLIGNPQGEEKTQVEQIEEEMLKAAILDAVLVYGNYSLKYKGIDLLLDPSIRSHMTKNSHSPEIFYKHDDLLYIQLGRKDITFNPTYKNPLHLFVAVESQLSEEIKKNRTKDNMTKYEDAMNLHLLVRAYSMRASMSVMDNTIRIIACFNETEMQIRVHSYNYTCREGGCSRPANPNHQDVTLVELISQFSESKEQDTSLRDDYMVWWDDEKDWMVYRDALNMVYHDYMIVHQEFIGTTLEQLTPLQINKLHEKVQNPDFVLYLGDVP